ncbi:unnamed protein product, partial [Scytosiphon promiscuus]
MAPPAASGEVDSSRRKSPYSAKKSAPSLRRRRSRSWHEFASKDRVPSRPASLATLKVRPADDDDDIDDDHGGGMTSPLSSLAAAERPLSLGSSRGGPAHPETVSAGAPSPRVSRKWYRFFVKRRKSAAGSPSAQATAAAAAAAGTAASSDRGGDGGRSKENKGSNEAAAAHVERPRAGESDGFLDRKDVAVAEAAAAAAAAGEVEENRSGCGSAGEDSEGRAGGPDAPGHVHATEQQQRSRGTATPAQSSQPTAAAVPASAGEEPGQAAERVGAMDVAAPRTPPSAARPTLPSYEEARRRAQDRRRQHKQQDHRGGQTRTLPGPRDSVDSASATGGQEQAGGSGRRR